jgi:AraC-like DNA-binding protein
MNDWYKFVIMGAFVFPWPARCLPRVEVAGPFPMLVPGCNIVYRGPSIALHLHDYAGDFWLGRRRFRLEPGDITISPHGVPSRYRLPESGTHLCIHFRPVTGADRVGLPLHFRPGAQVAAARERFWRVIDHARQSGGSAAAGAASAALQELLLWLSLQSRRGPAPRRHSGVEEALRRVRARADASLAQAVQVADLAAGCGLSADYAARLFARRHGMTLTHYLLLRRMELARHLLVSSEFGVAEIGRRVGLPDPQYFNKQFRRVAGVSPLAYRRQRSRRSRAALKARPR